LITVETAFILPLLLILVFGVLEYGWMFLKASEVATAARRGARSAIVPAVVTVDQVVDQSQSPVPPAVAVLAGAGIPIRPDTITVPTGVTPGPGGLVTVVVSVPYSDVRLFGLPFIPTPQFLRASVTMAKEGP
jgi:Flp pilus assembly protein TadG